MQKASTSHVGWLLKGKRCAVQHARVGSGQSGPELWDLAALCTCYVCTTCAVSRTSLDGLLHGPSLDLVTSAAKSDGEAPGSRNVTENYITRGAKGGGGGGVRPQPTNA